MVSRLFLEAIGAISITGFLLAAFTPMVELVGALLNPDRSLEHAQAIVVLGAGGVAAGGGLTDPSLRATMEGVKLFQQGWAPLLVFSGGAEGSQPAEADVRAEFARKNGVPASAILTVTTARTTHEEAVRMRALFQPRNIRKILLVADGPGMNRATAVFDRAGFDVVPVPWSSAWNVEGSPEERLSLLRQIAMEVVARAYYRGMGYL